LNLYNENAHNASVTVFDGIESSGRTPYSAFRDKINSGPQRKLPHPPANRIVANKFVEKTATKKLCQWCSI
jgi:hypothetical protein